MKKNPFFLWKKNNIPLLHCPQALLALSKNATVEVTPEKEPHESVRCKVASEENIRRLIKCASGNRRNFRCPYQFRGCSISGLTFPDGQRKQLTRILFLSAQRILFFFWFCHWPGINDLFPTFSPKCRALLPGNFQMFRWFSQAWQCLGKPNLPLQPGFFDNLKSCQFCAVVVLHRWQKSIEKLELRLCTGSHPQMCTWMSVLCRYCAAAYICDAHISQWNLPINVQECTHKGKTTFRKTYGEGKAMGRIVEFRFFPQLCLGFPQRYCCLVSSIVLPACVMTLKNSFLRLCCRKFNYLFFAHTFCALCFFQMHPASMGVCFHFLRCLPDECRSDSCDGTSTPN